MKHGEYSNRAPSSGALEMHLCVCFFLFCFPIAILIQRVMSFGEVEPAVIWKIMLVLSVVVLGI